MIVVVVVVVAAAATAAAAAAAVEILFSHVRGLVISIAVRSLNEVSIVCQQ